MHSDELANNPIAEPSFLRRFKAGSVELILKLFAWPYTLWIRHMAFQGQQDFLDDLLLPVDTELNNRIADLQAEWNTLIKFRNKIPPHHIATGYHHPASESLMWRTQAIWLNGFDIPQHQDVFQQSLELAEAIPDCVNMNYECVGPKTSIALHFNRIPNKIRCVIPIELKQSEYDSRVEIKTSTRKLEWRKLLIVDAAKPQEYFNASDQWMILMMIEIKRPSSVILELYNKWLIFLERYAKSDDRIRFCMNHRAELTLSRARKYG